MNLKKKILAGIVTYNRSTLLVRCIKALKSQVKIGNIELSILVINNSSTDNTEELLNSFQISYITLKNKGAVYGWQKLIQFSIDQNFDYLWLMDDDGYPDKQSLKFLIEFANKREFAVINSLVINENNHNELAFPLPILNSYGFPKIFSFPRKIYFKNKIYQLSEKGFYRFCHLFNGSFFSVNILRKSGNVNLKYKIYGEELDLFYRLKKIGDCFTIFKSLHYHPKLDFNKMNEFRSSQWLSNSLEINTKYMDHFILRNVLLILKFMYIFFGKISFKTYLFSIYRSLFKIF